MFKLLLTDYNKRLTEKEGEDGILQDTLEKVEGPTPRPMSRWKESSYVKERVDLMIRRG